MKSLIEYLTNRTTLLLRQTSVLAWMFLVSSSVNGQESIDLATDSLDTEITYEKKNSFKSVFYGQPGKAALYSLIVPGGGQFYNKRWWKIPLVWAGEGYFIYNLANSIENFQSWETCRLGYLDPDVTPVCEGTVSSATEAFEQQQSAKAAKERAWLFVIAAHLIQTLEAFVDRHLINFNTSENLTHNSITPHFKTNEFNTAAVTVFSVSINLNRLAD